jgi:phosphoenolpyruvate---glycerone phosphotransferase subunit DhaL
MSAIPFETFRGALLAAGDRVCAAQEQLCALDAAAGDGDLGTTLSKGFTAARGPVEGWAGEPDCGAVLTELGRVLAREAPSTMGTLLATAFMSAGRSVAGSAELDAEAVATILRSAANNVAERGGATSGQRTVLDALEPAAAAAESAVAAGDEPSRVLHAAASAAQAGAAATAAMEPAHGRAAWIGERAAGQPDGGAFAWSVYLTGLADAVIETPSKGDR